jgi:CRISPR-associated protein (TIGR02584 family)
MPETLRYRNVFFVSGRTPQIITETLFFFLKRQRPAIRPHEIHVLTTLEGQALIHRQLLASGGGQFFRFCAECRLNPLTIRFSEQTVEVLRDEHGRPLGDTRTDADNRVAADQIVAKYGR